MTEYLAIAFLVENIKPPNGSMHSQHLCLPRRPYDWRPLRHIRAFGATSWDPYICHGTGEAYGNTVVRCLCRAKLRRLRRARIPLLSGQRNYLLRLPGDNPSQHVSLAASLPFMVFHRCRGQCAVPGPYRDTITMAGGRRLSRDDTTPIVFHSDWMRNIHGGKKEKLLRPARSHPITYGPPNTQRHR